MNHKIRTSAFSLMMLLMLTAQLNPGQIGVLEAQSSKKKFSVLGYYPWPVACHPVLVKAVSIGATPPEVLTAQVTLISFSAKQVAAVKLRWDVYRWDLATKKRRAGCDRGSEAAEIFLSGTTPLSPKYNSRTAPRGQERQNNLMGNNSSTAKRSLSQIFCRRTRSNELDGLGNDSFVFTGKDKQKHGNLFLIQRQCRRQSFRTFR